MEFIAHKTDDGKIQTLQEHISGTTEIAKEIGNKCNIENISALTTKFHDVAKATCQFLDYITGKIDSAGEHAYSGAKLIKEWFGDDKSKEAQILIELISKSIAMHHGTQDFTNKVGSPILSKSIEHANNCEEAKKNISTIFNKEELLDIFGKAKTELRSVNNKINELTDETIKKGKGLETKRKNITNIYWGLFIRLVISILRYSDVRDSIDFSNGYKESYMPDWSTPLKQLEDDYSEFAKSTDKVNKKRTEISDRAMLFTNHESKICTLSMPTGSGKTLTSLRFALQYCCNYNKDKIFYVAPFLSILGPNAAVIKKYLGDQLLEHHSDVQIDDDDIKHSELCEMWDNTSVIATSFVQFFNALYKDNGSAIRKFQSLINSVIILDEVQEIPTTTTYITNIIINFLTHFMGATVILCSASIPPFDKQHIPMLIDENNSITGKTEEDFKFFNKVKLQIVPDLKKALTEDEINTYCKKIYDESENLVVIANTKKAVRYFKNIYEKFVPSENIYCLSTRKCSKHLKDDINTIKERLKRGDKIVCISTQLIEAGVDISFQTGIRTFAGLDSLLQTLGRVCRNGEYVNSKLYIFNIGFNKNIENLSQIPYIKNAINDAKGVLSKVKTEDIINQDTLSDYFKDVYGVRDGCVINKEKYAGYIESENCCLIDYLTASSSISKEAFNQKLKSFGEQFNIIDDYTNAVIVNLDKTSDDIINKIITNSLTKADIRKSYRYTVGLSDTELVSYMSTGRVKYSEEYSIYYIDIPDTIYTPQFGLLFSDELPSFTVL